MAKTVLHKTRMAGGDRAWVEIRARALVRDYGRKVKSEIVQVDSGFELFAWLTSRERADHDRTLRELADWSE